MERLLTSRYPGALCSSAKPATYEQTIQVVCAAKSPASAGFRELQVFTETIVHTAVRLCFLQVDRLLKSGQTAKHVFARGYFATDCDESAAAAMTEATRDALDLRGLSKYFDNLVDLVPPQFYHESEHEHVNLKYLKKSERAAVKRKFKEDYKKNKRAKLDPAQAQTSTSLQQQKAQQQEQRSTADLDEADSSDEADVEELAAGHRANPGQAGHIMKIAPDGVRPPRHDVCFPGLH